MRGRPAATRGPFIALPVDQSRWSFSRHALPPDVPVRRKRNVGEDHVLAQHLHRVRIGRLRRSRRDPEESRLGIDRVEASVVAGLDPGNVLADRRHLPAFERGRRDHHREIGLAAGAWKRCRYIGLHPVGRLDSENEHVLGQPALVPGHHRGNAKRQALLAQQRVPAVARAVGPYLARLGKVNDPLFLLVAWPGHVLRPRRKWRADRMHARYKISVFAEPFGDGSTHTRHDAHVDHHVRRIADLRSDLGDMGSDWPHRERHHVHRAAPHAAVEQAVHRAAHLLRVHPIIGRARVFLALAADEGTVFHPRDVRGV